MSYFEKARDAINNTHGVDACYAIRRYGSIFNTSVILQHFADNSFWARDAAVRCVVDKIKTHTELAETVERAFNSESYKWASRDKDFQNNFTKSVAKMVGLSAMALRWGGGGGEGFNISSGRILVWAPEDITVAAVNDKGRISSLKPGWEQNYAGMAYRLRDKLALV